MPSLKSYEIHNVRSFASFVGVVLQWRGVRDLGPLIWRTLMLIREEMVWRMVWYAVAAWPCQRDFSVVTWHESCKNCLYWHIAERQTMIDCKLWFLGSDCGISRYPPKKLRNDRSLLQQWRCLPLWCWKSFMAIKLQCSTQWCSVNRSRVVGFFDDLSHMIPDHPTQQLRLGSILDRCHGSEW